MFSVWPLPLYVQIGFMSVTTIVHSLLEFVRECFLLYVCEYGCVNVNASVRATRLRLCDARLCEHMCLLFACVLSMFLCVFCKRLSECARFECFFCVSSVFMCACVCQCVCVCVCVRVSLFM